MDPDYITRLENICIDTKVWDRLVEYWRKEDKDSGREIDSNIQEAIEEYLYEREKGYKCPKCRIPMVLMFRKQRSTELETDWQCPRCGQEIIDHDGMGKCKQK